MNRSWVWGVVVGVVGYWAVQHFVGVGVTGRGRTG